MASNYKIPTDPLWYKDAVIYEAHVRSFYDENGDGVGDFKGLTKKLDHIRDLGVDALWLLPFSPSPLRDDGYDVTDFVGIHSMYGTLSDFRSFLREAHRRDLRVITELVLNHTSDQHPWFQRARRARPGTPHRDFYVWSDSPNKYADARIIFKDFERSNWTWDPFAKSYYWHRFYSHQPDLNFDNPDVQKEMFQVIDFWLDLGVDGLRLDAVPYLFERENTICENLPETHEFLKKIRKHVDDRHPGRVLLAEANQWPEDAAAYFGSGDECHMAFHFPIMPRLFMATHMEDRFPIIDILNQTPEIAPNCQWALFLRNHDELTLEMVTDEERDYMYRVYAQDPQARINLGIRRRLAPLLGNNRRRFELLHGLLLSLPGTPVIYYGDEIGMGDNMYLGDRNGVRTPMQWSADRNAGFSRANPQKLFLPVVIDPEYHYEAVNVEAQQNNPSSLLWWMKRMILLRKRLTAFGRGSIEFLQPDNRKVLAFIRQYEDELVLVVANLSRYSQYVELDLSAYEGMHPIEMFGRTEFPRIGSLPYFVTLGPHSFYWFQLGQAKPGEDGDHSGLLTRKLPLIELAGPDAELFGSRKKATLESLLPDYIQNQPWFGAEAHQIKSTRILDVIPVEHGENTTYLTLIRMEFLEGGPSTYVVPLSLGKRAHADHIQKWIPQAIVAQVRWEHSGEVGVLFDGASDPEFCRSLLDAIVRRRTLKGTSGSLRTLSTPALRTLRGDPDVALDAVPYRTDGRNTSIVVGEKLLWKLFRKPVDGESPDLEISRMLTEKTTFQNHAPLAGAIEYDRGSGERVTVGVLKEFIQNEGDAWQFTLDHLKQFIESVQAGMSEGSQDPPELSTNLVEVLEQELPESAANWIGSYLASARLLGERTAEMHLALASDTGNERFRPEPFDPHYKRSVYQSMRNLTNSVMEILRRRGPGLMGPIRDEVLDLLSKEGEILATFKEVLDIDIASTRIRCHGDFHLGQILFTGKDFVIIDFEGDPNSPLGERRIKRSPLRDVAAMLRSFHYAAHKALLNELSSGMVREEMAGPLEKWIQFWQMSVSAAYLGSYFDRVGDAEFSPRSQEELDALLRIFLLEKAVSELGFELMHRPEWLRVPLMGIHSLIRSGKNQNPGE